MAFRRNADLKSTPSRHATKRVLRVQRCGFQIRVPVLTQLRCLPVSVQESALRAGGWHGSHLHGDRLTAVTPAGEIPFIGEILTLFRLHRIDPAVNPVQKNAGAIFLLDQ